MENPALKKRWLIIPTIAIPILIWVIWLFQSHNSTEKVYASDRQYSYYLEEYNYNTVLIKIMGNCLYESDYKVFIIDEITGKKLRSGYAGGKTVLRDYFGFQEDIPVKDSDRSGRIWFHFTKTDYFELPRPYDRDAANVEKRRQKAIKKAARQANLRVKAIADSIRFENKCAEVRQLFNKQRAESPITEQEIAYLRPIMQKWLDFYDIDLSQARRANLVEGTCIICPRDPEEDLYYCEFGFEDDSPSFVQMSYSPNKQRYVDMLIDVEMRDGVWHDIGNYDIDQSVYFIDRNLKLKNHLIWNGSSRRIEDIFWKNDDVFVTVGFSYFNVLLFQIDVYDLSARIQKTYEVLFEGNPRMLQNLFGSYHNEVYLPSRGIVPYRFYQ